MLARILFFLFTFTIVFAAIANNNNNNNNNNNKMSDHPKLPEPVDISFIKIDGKDEKKAPVLIYHGIFGTKNDWAKLGKKISELSNRTVYCFDIRDHGDSPWTKEFSLKAAISDMAHFVKKHNINRALLLGHSLGGMIFSRFATLFPEMVEKFVLVDIYPKKDSPKVEPNFMKLFALFLKNAVETIRSEKITDLELAKERLDELIKDYVKEEREEYKDRLCIKNGQISWKFNIDSIIDFLDGKTEGEDITPDFKGSCLEIYGGKSMIFKKEDCEVVLKYLPNTKFECVEESGHNPHCTHPKEFIEKLIPFVNS